MRGSHLLIAVVTVSLAFAFMSTAAPAASSGLAATDIVSSVGINPVYDVYTWGDASIIDINHDGYNDILLSRHNRDTWQLFRFNPSTGKYVDIWHVPLADHHACVWGDPNRDGRVDLFCVNGAGAGTNTGPNNLFIQQADGSFVDRASAWGVTDPYGRGRDATFLDANQDGRDDLLVLNRTDRTDGKPSINHLYINTGNGTYVDKTADFGINAAVGGSCVTTTDLNGDGFIDIYSCDEHEDWSPGTGGHLYINDHGLRFLDRTSAAGLVGLKPVDAEFGDFDNDGHPDLAIAQSTGPRVMRNSGGLFNTVLMQKTSSTQVVDLATGDVDGDGRLDVYVVANGTQDRLWMNDGSSWPMLTTPEATSGIGETATMIPNWNGHGRAAIYVGNGSHTSPGPRQWIVVSSSSTARHYLEAEDYRTGGEGIGYHDTTPGNTGGAYRNDNVDIQATTDTDGGYNVGWIAAGEWLAYNINVGTGGSHSFSVRVASPNTGERFHIEIDGSNVSGVVSVPNTGGCQSWRTVTTGTMNISAGTHTLKLVSETGGFNINYLDLNLVQTGISLPGHAEAEGYRAGGEGIGYHDTTAGNSGGVYRQDGVDIQTCTDTTTPAGQPCYNVGWPSAGEWLAYDVSVSATSSFTIRVRVASIYGDRRLHFDIDGLNATGSVVVPNTGGWQNWTIITTPAFSITTGAHTLKLVEEMNGFNVNYFDVVK